MYRGGIDIGGTFTDMLLGGPHGPGGIGTTVHMVFAYERPAAAEAPPTPAASATVGEPTISTAPVPRPLPR